MFSRINSDFAVTGRELGPFEAHSDAHATTDTERGQAAFGLAPLHFEQQVCSRSGNRTRRLGGRFAIAPPLTFTIAGSQPMSLLTAQACAAKASLASTKSRSPTDQLALSRALRLA